MHHTFHIFVWTVGSTLLLIFMSAANPLHAGERKEYKWQSELRNTSQQSDYRETFIVVSGGKTHRIIVDAKGCRKFDTRCIWQYARSWIGTALDDLDAKKISFPKNMFPISGSVCTLTYSVYQENPEEILFQCQDNPLEKTHYTQIEKFLKKKFD